ncbi:hypothetical protein [Vulgatibacter sp.]
MKGEPNAITHGVLASLIFVGGGRFGLDTARAGSRREALATAAA